MLARSSSVIQSKPNALSKQASHENYSQANRQNYKKQQKDAWFLSRWALAPVPPNRRFHPPNNPNAAAAPDPNPTRKRGTAIPTRRVSEGRPIPTRRVSEGRPIPTRRVSEGQQSYTPCRMKRIVPKTTIPPGVAPRRRTDRAVVRRDLPRVG